MKVFYYFRSHFTKFFILAFFVSIQATGQTWNTMVNGQGFNDQVLSLYTDNDNNTLYAGGAFTMVDGTTVNGIAKWDGSKWEAMGDGFAGTQPYVYWITKYNNEIYAGGTFTHSGTEVINGIAKWNGTQWVSVGGSMVFSGTFDNVSAMYVFNNELYVGGRFDSVGTVSAVNVAKWDGNNWTAIGNDANDDVLVIKEHNNELYIGGFFVFAAPTGQQYRIAKLKGNVFEKVGNIGLGDATARWSVETIATYKGELYAGGYFNVLESGSTTANNIAKWDGTKWSVIKGPGVGLASSSVNPVRSLLEYKGKLYVGGHFFAAGQVAAPNLATWDGTDWKNADLGTDDVINAMTVYGGNLIVAGNFSKAGGQNHKYIVQFNPATSISETAKQEEFTIYPNPLVSNSFKVQVNETGKVLSYQVYDLKGQRVANGEMSVDRTITLSHQLPAGTYTIQLINADGIYGTQTLKVSN